MSLPQKAYILAKKSRNDEYRSTFACSCTAVQITYTRDLRSTISTTQPRSTYSPRTVSTVTKSLVARTVDTTVTAVIAPYDRIGCNTPAMRQYHPRRPLSDTRKRPSLGRVNLCVWRDPRRAYLVQAVTSGILYRSTHARTFYGSAWLPATDQQGTICLPFPNGIAQGTDSPTQRDSTISSYPPRRIASAPLSSISFMGPHSLTHIALLRSGSRCLFIGNTRRSRCGTLCTSVPIQQSHAATSNYGT